VNAACRHGAVVNLPLSGTGDPRVARDPRGHGFGQKFVPVTGHGFFSGRVLCSRARVWVGKTQRVRARCQPYSWASCAQALLVRVAPEPLGD